MKTICQNTLKQILHYDPITGIFTWVKKISARVVIGKRAGSKRPNGYRFIRINKIPYREHHLAFLYMLGYLPTLQIDHINHNPSDNSWDNLREATAKENGKNHPKTVRNKTGFVGVSQRPNGKYVARIYVNNKHIFLGAFKTFDEAKVARQEANIQYNFHPNHGT